MSDPKQNAGPEKPTVKTEVEPGGRYIVANTEVNAFGVPTGTPESKARELHEQGGDDVRNMTDVLDRNLPVETADDEPKASRKR